MSTSTSEPEVSANASQETVRFKPVVVQAPVAAPVRRPQKSMARRIVRRIIGPNLMQKKG